MQDNCTPTDHCIPTVQQTHQCVPANRSPSTPTQTDGVAVASQPRQPNRMVSSKRPANRPTRSRCLPNTRPRQQPTCSPHGVAEASKEIGQPTCACRQSDQKTMVPPARPEIDRGTSVPPGVCGIWPLLAVWDPGDDQTTPLIRSADQ